MRTLAKDTLLAPLGCGNRAQWHLQSCNRSTSADSYGPIWQPGFALRLIYVHRHLSTGAAPGRGSHCGEIVLLVWAVTPHVLSVCRPITRFRTQRGSIRRKTSTVSMQPSSVSSPSPTSTSKPASSPGPSAPPPPRAWLLAGWGWVCVCITGEAQSPPISSSLYRYLKRLHGTKCVEEK